MITTPTTMPRRKRSEHYVNNKEFLEALVLHRKNVERHFYSQYGREPTKEDRAKKWEENHPSQTILENAF